jgi:S-adenosylmethionine:tRNA ribosyltransferase-isomerase
LPLDEPYRIPAATAIAIRQTRARGGRIDAIGATVVRALEYAASRDGRVRAGEVLATQRIDAETRVRVVVAILTGTPVMRSRAAGRPVPESARRSSPW